jgi:hypothetical protein
MWHDRLYENHEAAIADFSASSTSFPGEGAIPER